MDSALLCTVPLFKGVDHLMMSRRVVEVEEEGGMVIVMDFCY
jgi:hypothetical protein